MTCRLCSEDSVELHFDFGEQPIVNHLIDSEDQPYKKHPFKVGYCHVCGLLQLIDHIKPEDLYQNYFTVSAWKAQPHAPRLIQLMESVFGIEHQTRILEIGCNDGTFMELLANHKYKNAIGFEPTQDAFELALGRGLNVVNDFFDPNTATSLMGGENPDLIVSRQVIEHIPDLHAFLDGVSEVLNPGGGLVLEMPDHSMNYETLDYTFWEEHVNYFTLNTMRSLLALHGFEIVHHESTLFSGKAFFVFARKSNSDTPRSISVNPDHEQAIRYRDLYPELRNGMIKMLEGVSDRGVALYGGGARSCNFINLLGLGDYIDYIIDDQPEKQNKIVPGANLTMRSYSRELDKDKFFLLGVNCEVEAKVVRKRALSQFASVLPPSVNLPRFWQELAQIKI